MSCLREERVALVTGGSRGIGAAIVKELATHGYNTIVNYKERLQEAEALVAGIVEEGGRSIAVGADIRDRDQVDRMVDNVLEAFGRIDVLVNNAGINRDRTLARMTDEEWEEVIATDLSGVFFCTRAVTPGMVKRRWGRVVNLSSVVGQMGSIGQSNYAAAKAGVIGFTRSLALELARYNITVNAICPGFIDTDMVSTLSDSIRQSILDRIPLRRFGDPEEIARLCRFLVTEGDYITGAQLSINGGIHIQ